MNRTSLLVLTSCALFAPALLAQGQNTQRTEAGQTAMPTNARQFRSLRVPGEQVEKNVARLNKEVHFYKTLGAALGAGRAQGKPVVWIQALGEVDGFL